MVNPEAKSPFQNYSTDLYQKDFGCQAGIHKRKRAKEPKTKIDSQMGAKRRSSACYICAPTNEGENPVTASETGEPKCRYNLLEIGVITILE